MACLISASRYTTQRAASDRLGISVFCTPLFYITCVWIHTFYAEQPLHPHISLAGIPMAAITSPTFLNTAIIWHAYFPLCPLSSISMV